MSSKKIRIGIDIGKDGGIAVFTDGALSFQAFPNKEEGTGKFKKLKKGGKKEITKPVIDWDAYTNILLEFAQSTDDIFCVLEDLHSVYGTSAGSNFSFGFNCGATEMIIRTLGIPYQAVAPKAWQKEIWQSGDLVEEVSYEKKIKGQPLVPKIDKKTGLIKKKTDTKATSLQAANRLFPGVLFLATERSKVAHDGIVDAVLLAEYAQRIKV